MFNGQCKRIFGGGKYYYADYMLHRLTLHKVEYCSCLSAYSIKFWKMTMIAVSFHCNNSVLL